MLTVIAIIGVLTSLLSVAILAARRHAYNIACQHNLQQIGTEVLDLAQTHGGLMPGLLDAYPNPNPIVNGSPVQVCDYGFPWWARVYQQMEPDSSGGLGLLFTKNSSGQYVPENSPAPLDTILNPAAHALTGQLPPTFAKLFHCPRAAALDNTNAASLFNSISYGINFDVKDANGNPYCSNPNAVTPNLPIYNSTLSTNPPNSVSYDFLNNALTAQDKMPDAYYLSEIQQPGQFILISDAYTGDSPPPGPPAPSAVPAWQWTAGSSNPTHPTWTGSRISMGDPTAANPAPAGYERGPSAAMNYNDSPPYNAPIVGRHDGYANVLYGDLHVAAVPVVPGGTLTNNINVNTPFWTLSGIEVAKRIVKIAGLEVGEGRPLLLVAGPCVIESPELCFRVAEAVRKVCRRLDIPFVFKASYDKANRTSAGSFRGPGLDAGLRTLEEVRRRFGVPVLSDVHLPEHCLPAAHALDALQIPAFLCRQTDLIVAAARTGKPLNIKKAQFLAPEDMGPVCDKARAAGNGRLLLTERGTSFGYHRLVNDMTAVPRMQALGCPVLFDGTHSVQQPGGQGDRSGGDRAMIVPLSLAAVAAGADGLFLEVHPKPEKALSDAASMLPLSALAPLLDQARRVREALGRP